MNQTAYFKYFVLSLFFVGLSIEARLLKPSKDGEKKEILLINGKEGFITQLKLKV